MISPRIESIKEISMDFDRVLKYIPFQSIEYTPDPEKSVLQRFGDAFEAVMNGLRICHIPGTRLAGCGGDKFCARPIHVLEAEIDAMREYPKSCSRELIDSINEEMFYLLPYNAGHIIVDHRMILASGVNGIIDRIKERLQEENIDERGRDYLQEAIREFEAVKRLAKRHEEYYRELARKETDEEIKKEYTEIADTIGEVPENPAKNFRQALQSLWFMYMCAQFDDLSCHSLGRLDQYLYPYYIHDIASGLLDRGTAKELFYDFWLKYSAPYTISEKLGRNAWKGVGEAATDAENGLSWMVTKIIDEKHLDDGQTVDIGGLDYDGNDAVNELSWMVLSAVRELKTIEPKPVLKEAAKTNELFIRACYDLITAGRALPAIAYDENSIRAMREEPTEYSERDMIDYCHIGCVELAVPGKSYTDPMNAFINLAKVLSVTMGMGSAGRRHIGLNLPEPGSWDEFFDQYLAQMEYFIDMYVKGANESVPFYNQYYVRPMTSALIDGSIEKATLLDEGGAVYWSKCINCCGLATAADSLMAIKQVVYDEKRISLGEFKEILSSNFKDKEDFRQMLLNKVPKYGNGEKEVDAIAKRVAERFCTHVQQCRTFNGHYYRPGMYSFYATVQRQGKATPATPNGRKAGDILSLNISPDHGTMKNGLAAALQSITCFPHGLATNACATDVHLSGNTPPQLIDTINRYIEKHGGLLSQYTFANVDDMRDAQVHPEWYKDLIVRVTGFSAHFVSLDKGTQEEIMRRSYWV